jgi:hemerythrin superfamily protein
MKSTQSVAVPIVDMLKEDHEKVNRFFEEYEEADARRKQEIAKTAIQELEVHAALEEKLIYPTIREAIDADELMNEAIEEHHVVHLLIRELKKLKPGDEKFDAKFSVLGEMVKHHIEEEETEMLPQAEESDIDWDELTAQVMKRKEQLMARPSGNARGSTRKASKRARR